MSQRMEIEGTRRSRRDMSPAGRVRAAGMARERVRCLIEHYSTI